MCEKIFTLPIEKGYFSLLAVLVETAVKGYPEKGYETGRPFSEHPKRLACRMSCLSSDGSR
jgi:hypothetical protein